MGRSARECEGRRIGSEPHPLILWPIGRVAKGFGIAADDVVNPWGDRLRRNIFLVITALILLGLAAAAGHWYLTGRWIEATDNAYVEADIAVIAPRVAGYVKTVAVADNQAVRAGDVLAELDDVDYRARVAAGEADVARMGNMVSAAEATTVSKAAMIDEAAAALVAAEAEFARADADRVRLQSLLGNRFVSRQRFEVAVAEATSRRAAVAQARAALAAARSGVAGAGAERGASVAGGRAASAQLASARYDLSNTIIRAPLTGVVGNRSARVGQYVRAGQQLMVVVPVNEAYVIANFKETQVARMRPGQRVSIAADAYPDAQLTGRIASLSPAAGSRFSILPPENATGNFTKVVQRIPVKILIDRPLPEGVRLVPGLSVRPSIDVGN